MKVLIVLLPLIATCFTAELPSQETKKGFLVLPKDVSTVKTYSTSTSQNDGNENLEDVNARVMEQLRQQQGSERGVYHVYLEDGRLQRVQYTTAPLSSAPQAASANYNQGQQTPEILSPEYAERRGVYFVQVPQERLQALVAKGQQGSQQSSQAVSYAEYNQQPSTPVNVRYVPLQESDLPGFGSNSQYRSAEPVVRFAPFSESSNAYQQQQQQQQESGYVANVQYSEVKPIQGPVYSYSPSSITRILRYAPAF